MEKQLIEEHHNKCESIKAEMRADGIAGEWDSEPNRLNWIHAGLDCMLIRQPTQLHWCGYVGVKPGHPAFGKEYDDVNVKAPGGLTYADSCQHFICHITDDPEDKTWWLGFDCAHSDDISPRSIQLDRELNITHNWGTYKDLAFVRRWTEKLAEQLAEMKQ